MRCDFFHLSSDLSPLTSLFITGTDTGVGKSIFTSILALNYQSAGKKVAISKPIQTGKPKDTDLLKELTGNKVPIFNTYSFELPSAPSVASAYENNKVEIERVILDIKKLEKDFDVVLVEGIGGIAVPLSLRAKQSNPDQDCGACPEQSAGVANTSRNDIYLVSDLIKDLNYPAIIVARPILGTINHTVLTIEFAKRKGLSVLGFVISGYDENTNDPVIKTAPEEIKKITNYKCLAKIPFVKDLSSRRIDKLFNLSLCSN